MDNTNKLRFTWRVTPEVSKKLLALSKREARTINGQLNVIVDEYIKNYERQRQIKFVDDKYISTLQGLGINKEEERKRKELILIQNL